MKVVCESVGRIDACAECPHGSEHEEQWDGLRFATCRHTMACEVDEEVVRCVPVGTKKEGGDMNKDVVSVSGEGRGSVAGEGDETCAAKKRRKSSNYVLERRGPSESLPFGVVVWEQVNDWFASPKQAIEHIAKEKLTGTFRAVRVASDEYMAMLTTPEPVLTVKKVKKVKWAKVEEAK